MAAVRVGAAAWTGTGGAASATATSRPGAAGGAAPRMEASSRSPPPRAPSRWARRRRRPRAAPRRGRRGDRGGPELPADLRGAGTTRHRALAPPALPILARIGTAPRRHAVRARAEHPAILRMGRTEPFAWPRMTATSSPSQAGSTRRSPRRRRKAITRWASARSRAAGAARRRPSDAARGAGRRALARDRAVRRGLLDGREEAPGAVAERPPRPAGRARARPAPEEPCARMRRGPRDAPRPPPARRAGPAPPPASGPARGRARRPSDRRRRAAFGSA